MGLICTMPTPLDISPVVDFGGAVRGDFAAGRGLAGRRSSWPRPKPAADGARPSARRARQAGWTSEGPFGLSAVASVAATLLFSLERQDGVEDLLAVGRLLNLCQASATPPYEIPRLGDAGRSRWCWMRRCRPGARCLDGQDAQLGIDAHLLRTADEQIAVGQDVHDDGRHPEPEGGGGGVSSERCVSPRPVLCEPPPIWPLASPLVAEALEIERAPPRPAPPDVAAGNRGGVPTGCASGHGR